MLDKKMEAVYVHLENEEGQLRVMADKIPLHRVFCCGDKSPGELDFHFESSYSPYQQYSFDKIDNIDLVVKDLEGKFLSPLEVKLTVLPTDGTSTLPEEQWGCELVIRSATTSYCALGMYDAVREHRHDIRNIFEEASASIQMWDNDYEMCHKTPHLTSCIDTFQRRFLEYQKPLLMQTLWKTKGKSPELADNAFDIVIWSDYAFTRLFVDKAYHPAKKMSRPMRATARLARCLWELSKSGKIRLADIYRQMAFDNQTDKEFAINGTLWRKYVASDRITSPILPKSIVNDIIAPAAIQKLSPERRFDQTLYFTLIS